MRAACRSSFAVSRTVLPLSALVGALALAAPAGWADGPGAPAPAAHVGVAFLEGSSTFEAALAAAKTADKPLFVDFSTSWCGWCKRLDRDVFSRADVAETMTGFVCVRVAADEGEGIAISKRYGVHGFPTLVVVDAEGAEIDRIVGYRAADAFTKEMRRILAGEGTLPALRAAVAAAPDAAVPALALGSRLLDSDPPHALRLARKAADGAKAQGDRPLEASARLLAVRARLAGGDDGDDDHGNDDGDDDADDDGEDGPDDAKDDAQEDALEALGDLEAILVEFPETPAAEAAVQPAGRLLLVAPLPRALSFLERASAVVRSAAAKRTLAQVRLSLHAREMERSLVAMAEAAGDDAAALNEVAWTAYERRLAMRAAVDWARRAVELSKGDPMVLDTLANLLFETGDATAALALEEQAVAKANPQLAASLAETLARMRAVVRSREGPSEAEQGPASPPPVDATDPIPPTK